MLWAVLVQLVAGESTENVRAAARQAMSEGHPEEAAVLYERLVATEPSLDAFLELSRAREAQGRLVAALYATQEGCRYAQPGSSTLEECRTRVGALKGRVGWLGLRGMPPVPDQAFVDVAKERIPVSTVALSTPVDPGESTIVWQAPGFEPITLRVEVRSGQTIVLALPQLVPRVESKASAPSAVVTAMPKVRWPPIVTVAVGAVLAIAGGIGLGVTLTSHGRFDRARAEGPAAVSPPFTPQEETWIKSPGFGALYAGGWVASVTGVVAAIGGLIWMLVDPGAQSSASAAPLVHQ